MKANGDSILKICTACGRITDYDGCDDVVRALRERAAHDEGFLAAVLAFRDLRQAFVLAQEVPAGVQYK